MRLTTRLSLALLLLAVPAWSTPQLVKPFLDSNCIDCHDSETRKGGLDLEDLAYEPKQRGNARAFGHLQVA